MFSLQQLVMLIRVAHLTLARAKDILFWDGFLFILNTLSNIVQLM